MTDCYGNPHCHILLPPLEPSLNDFEDFVRLGLGHRRLTADYAAAVEIYAARSDHMPDYRFPSLLEGQPIPGVDARYTLTGNISDRLGPPRYALTSCGVDAVEAWLRANDPAAPVVALAGGTRAVLLILAGHGAGPLADSPLRKTTARRSAFAELSDDFWVVAEVVCAPNVAGLTREHLQESLAELMRNGAGPTLGIAAVPMHAQRVGQFVRHAVASGLVKQIAAKVEPAEPPMGILQPPAWNAIRKVLRNDTEISDQAWQFGGRLANRASVRRPLPQTVSNPSGVTERMALVSTQQVLASVLAHHPRHIWATASLLAFPVNVHPAGRPRAGHPTCRQPLDGLGQPSGHATPTHRTPDGALWHAPSDYPDVLVEFEGDGSRLLIVQHLETALWTSSVAQKHLTMVIGTTTRSASGVERAIRNYLSDNEHYLHRLDWPGASVEIRIAGLKLLTSNCPLHGEVDFHYVVRC